MPPRNNYNPKREEVVVFRSDKEPITVTRPNARELVATGEYFWSSEDIGKARIESDGPEDPSAELHTIYDKDGQAHEVSRANARDMVGTGEYTWVPAHAVTETGGDAEPVVKTATAPTETVVPEESTAEDSIDPVTSPLAKIAEKVAGKDVESYLGGFPIETLRDMAEQRYGEKIHHRASKDTVISKMVELEEAKLDSEDSSAE